MSQFDLSIRWLRPFVWALLVALAAPTAHADAPGAGSGEKQRSGQHVRMLNIGNSFSNNATRYLRELAEAGGHEITIGAAAIGGASLQRHWDAFEKSQAAGEGEAGPYPEGRTLTEMLTSQPWDYVTIQQASRISHDPSLHQPYADLLVAQIREHAPQAELLIHQTWAYRVDDPRFTGEPARESDPTTHQAMYEQVAAAYEQLADHFDARIVPVGDAFYLADTDPKWGYQPDTNFDFEAAEPPALPDQTHSLHTGWRWRKRSSGEPYLRIDGHHASVAGQYLAGCVFYELLFDDLVIDNPFVPEELDPAYARFLQVTAHRAVMNRRAAVPAGQ